MNRYRAVQLIGRERTIRAGTAEALAADPLIWASAEDIERRCLPGTFAEFAGPYGRCWRIERLARS